MSEHRLTRRALMAGTAGTAGAALLAAAPAARAAAAEVPPPSPYQVKPPHQIEAETLVEYLRTLPWGTEANRYKLAGQFPDDNSTAVWGEPGHPEQFRVLAQCSSFVSLVLERTYGPRSATEEQDPARWATKQYFRDYFGTEPGKLFPTAEKFRAGFANAAAIPHFTAVTKPVNLRPGDFVAFDYDEDATTTPYTGHIVMIRERKGTWASSADARVGAGVVPYVFEVIDCTSNPHGNPAASAGAEALYRAFPDTRIEERPDETPGWKEYNGVGYGHLVFYADATTKLFAGYRWGVNSTVAHPVSERPIAAARVYQG
ncbi:hypothetical protein AB0D08_07780 [Kitasatospora sp. NPDC048540]|uniref:hypothetical protein n=1 Tax=Kitasatospora sp. NPDC048540 TaxID=3155634 RepID=UPI0033D6AF89